MTSTQYTACTALLLVGAAVGSLPFIASFRTLPRWIRVGQCLAGIAAFTSGVLAFALYASGTRISDGLHHFIFFHVVFLGGMALGMILLVLVSGEYFKALRALDTARRQRLGAATPNHPSKNV